MQSVRSTGIPVTATNGARHADTSRQLPVPAALKSVTSETTGYVFPPVYSFPAFFTRQPNSTTFASQSRQWHALILDYCARQRLFRFDLSESALVRGSYELPNGNTETELWENKRIKRRARADFIQELIHMMVQNGSALYDPASKITSATPSSLPAGTGAIILWRSVEEWSQVIQHWVIETGQTNSIVTFDELQEPSSTKDFHDLPMPLLKLALGSLIKQNKAQIFQAGDGEGVKFF